MASESTVIGGIAGRYAVAIYDLAEEAEALDAVAQELTQLHQLISGSADLGKLVRSPVIDQAAKASAMAAVLEKAGGTDLVRRFVGVVAGNGRLFALTAIIDAFLAELARRRGEVTAQVVAAQPLSADQERSVLDILRKTSGGKVAMNVEVDPSLIGGLVVRVGSLMIDSSLKSKLQRLQLAMKGA